MAVIMQSPEVKTTKYAQPWSHGKQTNTKEHSHDVWTIWVMRSSIPQVKRRLLSKLRTCNVCLFHVQIAPHSFTGFPLNQTHGWVPCATNWLNGHPSEQHLDIHPLSLPSHHLCQPLPPIIIPPLLHHWIWYFWPPLVETITTGHIITLDGLIHP